jgi:hypothetical protein
MYGGKILLWSPVVHARSLERDATRSQTDRSRLRFSIAHNESVPVFITQMTELLDVLLYFQLQCGQDHASSTLSGQFVQ